MRAKTCSFHIFLEKNFIFTESATKIGNKYEKHEFFPTKISNDEFYTTEQHIFFITYFILNIHIEKQNRVIFIPCATY